MTDTARLTAIISFLQDAAALKDTLRSGRTGAGRLESVADHTWRLCLLVLLLEDDLAEVDVLHLLKLCLVHDLGEAISGDIPAIYQSADDGRDLRERADLVQLSGPLPPALQDKIVNLWDEYATGQTPEAQMAKGLDKLETMLQHVAGQQDDGFDFAWNLGYGRDRTDKTELLRALRTLVDQMTRDRI